jgi:hypothetical protein
MIPRLRIGFVALICAGGGISDHITLTGLIFKKTNDQTLCDLMTA